MRIENSASQHCSQSSALNPTHCQQVIVLEDREEYIAALPNGVAEQQQRAPFEPLVIINPRLRVLSDAGARFWEGCLSVPGYQVGLVSDWSHVFVQD